MSAEHLALRGMKEMWVTTTVEAGLRRPSAGWFAFEPTAQQAEQRATASTAIYLALSPRVREQLAAAPHRGGYTQFFRTNPGVRPVVLLFEDRPTGEETWHRYLWLGADSPTYTSCFTNVARAGRTVRFDQDRLELYAPSPEVIAEVEGRIDREIPEGYGGETELIMRVGSSELALPAKPPLRIETKIGAFCDGIAKHFLTVMRRTCY
ncbi:hypothetical protein ACWDXV_32575 [Nocardia nova]